MSKRRFPSRKCDGCKRLINGQFSDRCKQCANRYTGEYITRGAYKYKGAVLTVREWSALAECSPRALYGQLYATYGDLEEALGRMGKLYIVAAKLENGNDR